MSLLEMRGISKAFNGVPVLKEVQLTVEEGEVHALLGENGAGKSTLMNVLTGTIPLDAGTILFDGQELKNLSKIHSFCMNLHNLFATLRKFFLSILKHHFFQILDKPLL